MKKKKATPRKEDSLKDNQRNNNSVKSQHLRIKQALQNHPNGLTTIELVEQFDILRPGARICEMRWQKGLNIKSVRVSDTTAQGNIHPVVRYILMPGTWAGAVA